MAKPKTKSKRERTPLTQRILDADADIQVKEIVDPRRLKQLPPRIRDLFGAMLVKWAPKRAWGLSFQIGDPTVIVGHRRGDHIATFPWLHDLSANEAERLLRLQIEGTLLHELGHAVFDLYLKDHNGYAQAAQAALKDDPPSSYRGQDVDQMDAKELLHEMFAEAFRYWCHNDAELVATYPTWHALVDDAVANARRRVTARDNGGYSCASRSSRGQRRRVPQG